MYQLPLFNLSQQQPELLSNMTNQSGTRGILKISAPSISNLLSTFDGKKSSLKDEKNIFEFYR
jgi:hypothetical protein